MPPSAGECDKFTKRFYFSKDENVCKKFNYGGCGGNKNNFKSKEECANRCKVS